jgi:hypothetical protein
VWPIGVGDNVHDGETAQKLVGQMRHPDLDSGVARVES